MCTCSGDHVYLFRGSCVLVRGIHVCSLGGSCLLVYGVNIVREVPLYFGSGVMSILCFFSFIYVRSCFQQIQHIENEKNLPDSSTTSIARRLSS